MEMMQKEVESERLEGKERRRETEGKKDKGLFHSTLLGVPPMLL